MDFTKALPVGTIETIVITALFTGLITTLMGVFGKKAAESLMEIILYPFRWLTESIYRWIAPRNPFSISLWSYKKHLMRSNLTRIENPVGPSLSVPLEHAFAPLKLVSGDLQQSIDLFSHVATNYRSIVLGGPGTGKTTLMKSLVTSVVKASCHPELNHLIPVFIVLRNLARNEHSVKDAIIAAFAEYHFPGAMRFVASALSQGKMIIILDGLDEVGASREFVVNQILQFCDYDDQQDQKNRLLVTCREHAYQIKDLQLSIQEIVRVEPFANHHMRVFLNGWPEHKGRSAVNLYGLIQADAQIRDICRNPLLLTILTGLYLDADNFKIPTSRNQFYKSALDELLIQRPVRRQIKQIFHADDKRQVLERVALERLETATDFEDPEEFTNEAILQKAKEVMASDKINVREMIKEMIEINGIIRPSREGNYTCAHRTIQEYLAAREALRTRTTDEVVSHFSDKIDLIEVLYFYCGLFNNIPALTGIIQKFSDERRWIEAGRCLLNAREIVKEALIEDVAKGLVNQITIQPDFKLPLEVLASLSQRNDSAFDTVKKLFSDSIDHLAARDEHGASALESALAASPELAMKVVPGLLQHKSERWKMAAVQLLRDVGTDEALDKLVQLLINNDNFIREKAAYFLSGMIGNRNPDLIQRATLMPECSDASIWPLNDYFPGRLIIPIAESLVNIRDDVPVNKAVHCAIEATRARDNIGSTVSPIFLSRWIHLRRDLSIKSFCQRAKQVLNQFGIVAIIGLGFILFSLLSVCYYNSILILVDCKTAKVYQVENIWMENLKVRSLALTDELENTYPPNSEGLSRILPWNWRTEPLLQRDQAKAFEDIWAWEAMFDPYDLLRSFETTSSLAEQGILSSGRYADLQKSVMELRDHLPKLSLDTYLIIPSLKLHFLLIYLTLWVTLPLNLVLLTRTEMHKVFSPKFMSIKNIFIVAIPYVGLLFYLSIIPGTYVIKLILIGSIIILVLIGQLLVKLPWANNPLIIVVSDVSQVPTPLAGAGTGFK